VQLLYVMTPAGQPLPPAWDKSAARSLAALERLYDPQLGAYVISETQPIALLMDNCEVVAALRQVAAQKRQRGDAAGARGLRRRASQVERRLASLFPPDAQGLLRYTTEDEPETEKTFYPHATVQLYPLLHGLPSLLKKPAMDYRTWMRRYRDAWVNLAVDEFPWGLMAHAAYLQGDKPVVTCWVRKAAPLRHGERWNVLEDALWQGLFFHVDPDASCLPL
jgi:uncharacterized protein YbaR (Trm112 family)